MTNIILRIYRLTVQHTRLACALVPVLALLPVARAASDPVPRLTAPTLGKVFEPGAPITLTLAANAPIAWQVRSFDGALVATGQAQPVGGKATITLPPQPLGPYDVTGVAPGSTSPILSSSFAVLAAATGRRDGRFGVATLVGVNQPTTIAPLIARAGIASVRDIPYWTRTETKKGDYALDPAMAAYLPAVDAAGLGSIMTFGFGNALYDVDPSTKRAVTPYTTSGIAAYAAYGARLVSNLAKGADAVAVWNEYNGQFVDGPAAKNPDLSYTTLLQATYRAVKAARPEVMVIAGAASGIALSWYQKLGNRGALAFMDALDIHPYPKTAEYLDGRIRALSDLTLAVTGQRKAIIATEFGDLSNGPSKAHDLAPSLVKYATTMAAEGVMRMYWYSMVDNPGEPEYGLLARDGFDLRPKPAYASYANLIRQIDGRPFIRRETTDPRDRVYRFEDQRGPVLVAWSSEGTAALRIATTGPVQITDMFGNAQSLSPRNGAVSVRIDDTPIFFSGPVLAVDDQRADQVIASVFDDFATTQGSKGWYYGYESAPGAAFSPSAVWSEPGEVMWRGPAGNLIDRWTASVAARTGSYGAVRRWVSDRAGSVVITGSFEAISVSRRAKVAVRVGGKDVWTSQIQAKTSPRADFALQSTVGVGTPVDFVVESPASGVSPFQIGTVGQIRTVPTAAQLSAATTALAKAARAP